MSLFGNAFTKKINEGDEVTSFMDDFNQATVTRVEEGNTGVTLVAVEGSDILHNAARLVRVDDLDVNELGSINGFK